MPRDRKHSDSLIYGPVPSRRLGRSLGVDLVPYKTCTYDCIYCQIGRTPGTTVKRSLYSEPEKIIAELGAVLRKGVRPDYITIGGSGEPCLNSAIGAVIEEIKQISDIAVAVLTNGSLLWSRQVREDLGMADVVLPSLDACNEEMFARINRPHPDISFDRMLQGLVEFREVYQGRIWLEVFIVSGINDTPEAMTAFGSCMDAVRPDRIHINTAIRPPAEKYARQVPAERLERLASVLGRGAEVVAEYKEKGEAGHEENMDSRILDMISRRPCTTADIAAGLGLAEDYVARRMDEFSGFTGVEITKSGAGTYYFRKN